MINILYICTPNSIHDLKWMSYFAVQRDKYRVYAVGEIQNPISYREEEDLQNYNVKLLPPIFSFSLLRPNKTKKSIKMLKSYLKQYEIHFVHVLFATPYALWCSYINKPYIITTRGSDILKVIPELLKTKGTKRLYFRKLFKLFKKSFLGANTITCTSNQQQRKIKELYGLDSELIRTGIDFDRIQALEKEDLILPELKGLRFIFSPRFMKPIYNIEYQLNAIESVQESVIKDYTFLFVKGRNFEEAYFLNQKKRLEELKNSIGLKYLIVDYFNQETLWMHYKRASLCIMTPTSDGTPNSALEAMASKCPLIVSDLKYDTELFENTCIRTDLNDANSLALLIESALVNYKNEMLVNAVKQVKLNGNRTIEMEKLEKLYSSVI